LRIPPGVSLLLIGSGLYWILSSQLISSFTVLSPGLFQSLPSGQTLITVVGVIALAAGLWNVGIDLGEFRRITMGPNGYVFVLPLGLVGLDLYSTLISLSLNSQTMELNPFVASAIQYGSAAILPFIISYMALSQGLALLMLRIGRLLFGAKSVSLLPFASVFSASSFGPFSNLLGMEIGYSTFAVFLFAGAGSTMLAVMVWKSLRGTTALTPNGH
jgi:hypothetical protein